MRFSQYQQSLFSLDKIRPGLRQNRAAPADSYWSNFLCGPLPAAQKTAAQNGRLFAEHNAELVSVQLAFGNTDIVFLAALGDGDILHVAVVFVLGQGRHMVVQPAEQEFVV